MATNRRRLSSPHDNGHGPGRRSCLAIGLCLTTTALMMSSVLSAQSALGDTGDGLRAAVEATRGTSCGELTSNPVVDEAARAINATTDKWIDNASRAVPETDALTVLKDLGYAASKATILSGAAADDGDAIKALLLQGYAKIPDCSYKDFGVSALHNAKKDLTLTTVVLVVPA